MPLGLPPNPNLSYAHGSLQLPRAMGGSCIARLKGVAEGVHSSMGALHRLPAAPAEGGNIGPGGAPVATELARASKRFGTAPEPNSHGDLWLS